MKKFLAECGLFAVLVIAGLALGEYFVRTLPNPYQYKHQWMLQNGNELEVVILGSSHAYYGIAPSFLSDRAFSLANVSQDFKYDCLLLERYASLYEHLHTVIVPISYFSFFAKDLDEGEYWGTAINYKVYMDIPIHSNFSKYNFELSRLSVYGGKIRSFLSGEILTCDTLGHGEEYALQNKTYAWESAAVAAVKRHTAEKWDKLDENIARLQKIIEFCQTRSLSVILITTPTWSSYYDRLDKKQLAKMYEIIRRMQEKYNVPYYDYLKDPRFVADDFFDCDHLSSDVGAAKFTKILREDMEGEGRGSRKQIEKCF